MHEIIELLQEHAETVPVPLELPTFDDLVDVEEQILISLPVELKEYLLYASNLVVGSLEPVTAADPHSHTYLPEVTSYAWSLGMPRHLIAICQNGEYFYGIDEEGIVYLWDEINGIDEDQSWDSLWQWVSSVWLQK